MSENTAPHFILDFQRDDYPYLEETNEGILKQLPMVGNDAAILDVGAIIKGKSLLTKGSSMAANLMTAFQNLMCRLQKKTSR